MTNPRTKMVSRINVDAIKLREEANTAFLGISARFLDGKYEGRWGQVRAVMLDDRQGVMLLVSPYRSRVVGPNGLPTRIIDHDADFLSSHLDARSYRPVARYTFADDYAACRACNRQVASPCHDATGYREEGPWDGFCRDVLYPGC